MRKVNYKSDFDFLLRLTDCRGQEVLAPDCDWSVRIYTGGSRVNAYEAWRRGEEWHNAFDDGGRIHIVVNRPRIGVGTLRAEFHVGLPNVIYDDGVQDLYKPQTLDIELVDGPGDCPGTAEIELVLPYIKGDPGEPFTYADFTEEQKAELIAPIHDDIKRAIEDKQDKMSVSEDFELTADARLSLTDRAKQRLFDDMWNAACGKWGHVDHSHVEADGVERHYFLNSLWLTYAEAITIWRYTAYSNNYFPSYCRTNIPPKYVPAYGFTPKVWFSNIEVLNILPSGVSNENTQIPQNETFDWYTSTVRRVIGVMKATDKMYTSHARVLRSLEEIKISNINKDFVNLSGAPRVNLDSWKFLVANATNTKSITITVHPDVYAKLTDETNEEWHKVLTDALAKDISFATV